MSIAAKHPDTVQQAFAHQQGMVTAAPGAFQVQPHQQADQRELVLSPDELKRLDELDSLYFGVLNLSLMENVKDRNIAFRGIRALTRKLLEIQHLELRRAGNVQNADQHVDPYIYCKLGHLHLLVNDFRKAVSAYQRFRAMKDDYWKDSAFIYGLALAYFSFNAYSLAKTLFHELLYTDKSFVRAGEVNLRLGFIYKQEKNWSSAFKHFNLALNDSGSRTLSKEELKYHIAHCYDLQGYHSISKERYEEILSMPNVTPTTRALVLRHLGWLHHRAEEFGEKTQRETAAIDYLQSSLKIDESQGQTWYYLGRCYSSIAGRAHDAFVAYRHSIDKSESSADTWCSIGVLYQQQNQPMDALQAYICAVQLDRSHPSAWIDLGLLYEVSHQPDDALRCFITASQLAPDQVSAEGILERIKVLENHVTAYPQLRASSSPDHKRPDELPTLNEAFKLPIPTELTTRQKQISDTKIRHCIEGSSQLQPLVMRGAAAIDEIAKINSSQPLSQQQLNLLQVLHTNHNRLGVAEQNLLRALQTQYSLQQQQQQRQPVMEVKQEADTISMTDPTHLAFGELPQVSQEDLKALLGTVLPDDKTSSACDFADEILLHALNGADESSPADNDPLLSDAAFSAGFPTTNQDSRQHATTTTTTIPNLPAIQPSIPAPQAIRTANQMDTSSSPVAEMRPPPPLCLLAPCQVPLTLTASSIRDLCRKSLSDPNPTPETVILPDRCPPFRPPEVEERPDQLLIKTPSIVIENKREAFAQDLQEFCYNAPIAVIRGMSSALKLDLGLFSTKTLVEQGAEQQVEVRTQLLLPPDENTDAHGKTTWKCDSQRSFTTISKYAQYQAQSFQQALKEEQERIRANSKQNQASANGSSSIEYKPFSKRRKADGQHRTLRFGTNVDLSDDRRWKLQIQELLKLPGFLKVASASNMLSHLGHIVLGVNTVQAYMKVPGSRTPAHHENNNLSSVNINIGPGDCEWFASPHRYWSVFKNLCHKKGLEFIKNSWWPPTSDMADEHIPLYKFTQRPGDIVWVGPGTLHWVQALGWCNNIAWNVGPMISLQLDLALERYELNKQDAFKSIVPVCHLAWQLARNIKFTDAALFEGLKRILLRTLCYCFMVVEYLFGLSKHTRLYPRTKDEPAHYCGGCEVEVWNVLFITELNGKLVVHCLDCARHMDPQLLAFTVLNQYTLEELAETYDNFQLHPKVPGVLA